MIDSPLLQGLSYLNLAIGAAVSVLIALLILQRQRNQLKFLIATFYLLMAYGLATGWLARSGLMSAVPFLLYTTYVISFAHGPVLYLYTERLLSRTVRFRPANLLMFLPAASMLGVVVAYHAGFGDRSAALARRSPFPEIGDPVMYVLCSIADLSVVFYLALSGAKVRAAAPSAGPGKSGGLRFFFALYLASALTYLGVLAAHMLDDDAAAMAMSTANGLSALAYFLYVHQSPQITQRTLREPRTKRNGDGAREGIAPRLEAVMASEKLYRDSALSLASLSERLGVSTNRLSQALNDEMGTGFRPYVNSLRLEEAKRRLEENAGASILDIAFEAGFNSKTTFNTLFSRETGMTPKEYRQRRGNLPENLL